MRELGRDIVMIGRAPSNQIVIEHPTVSAHHAVLLRTGACYSLKDLNSANGTQINGDFVTDAELKDGDTLRFGSVIADCVRDDVSLLRLGVSPCDFKKKPCGSGAVRVRTPIRQPSERWHTTD